jgi:hypothetical protein
MHLELIRSILASLLNDFAVMILKKLPVSFRQNLSTLNTDNISRCSVRV